MLTKIRIRYLSKSRVEVTFVPTKLGRWLGVEVRRGLARRARDRENDWCWWWIMTDRYVGRRVERCIEAAPLPGIEELPIELLLGDGDAS
jgi:hypothetical protein